MDPIPTSKSMAFSRARLNAPKPLEMRMPNQGYNDQIGRNRTSQHIHFTDSVYACLNDSKLMGGVHSQHRQGNAKVIVQVSFGVDKVRLFPSTNQGYPWSKLSHSSRLSDYRTLESARTLAIRWKVKEYRQPPTAE